MPYGASSLSLLSTHTVLGQSEELLLPEYESTVVERCSSSICGYPPCSNHLGDLDLFPRAHSLLQQTAFQAQVEESMLDFPEIVSLENYCSVSCMKKSYGFAGCLKVTEIPLIRAPVSEFKQKPNTLASGEVREKAKDDTNADNNSFLSQYDVEPLGFDVLGSTFQRLWVVLNALCSPTHGGKPASAVEDEPTSEDPLVNLPGSQEAARREHFEISVRAIAMNTIERFTLEGSVALGFQRMISSFPYQRRMPFLNEDERRILVMFLLLRICEGDARERLEAALDDTPMDGLYIRELKELLK